MLAQFKACVARLKREVYVLYLVARDPQTPWSVRMLVAMIVAYALSPVDLIPDFIPVLGILDELILLPLGIALAIRLTPVEVIQRCRRQARAHADRTLPPSRAAALVVVSIWLLSAALALYWLGWRGAAM